MSRAALTPAEVLDRWADEGPLVHEPTGFEALDAATGGGPVYGSRWYVQGAPDAGKTAWLVHVAHEYAERGIVVGLLAVDEEPDDIVTRLAQRVGFRRQTCETREHDALERMHVELDGLPIRLYGPEWTIEEAARDLAAHVAPHGGRAMLGIDSIQVVKCDAERDAEREVSMAAAVELKVRAVRGVAIEHSLIVIATSEMGRAAYRDPSRRNRLDPMAAAKWSGAIEYGARVLVSLQNVPGESDLIEVELPKNKYGRARIASEGEALYLKIDRATQKLWEVAAPERIEDEEAGRVAVKARKSVKDAATVAAVMASSPGLGTRDLRDHCQAAPGHMSKGRVGPALARLGSAVVTLPGPRQSKLHYLDGSAIPEDVLGHVVSEARPAVITARPPSHELTAATGGDA